MISFGSSNPIFGVTTNPLDKTRSPGGSSSGEGALLGNGGSILGLGTDIGGSVRIPAAFCGISSLKPTSGRIFVGGRRVVCLFLLSEYKTCESKASIKYKRNN